MQYAKILQGSNELALQSLKVWMGSGDPFSIFIVETETIKWVNPKYHKDTNFLKSF